MKDILLTLFGIASLIVVVPIAIAFTIIGFLFSPIALLIVSVTSVRWEETMVVRYFLTCVMLLVILGIDDLCF